MTYSEKTTRVNLALRHEDKSWGFFQTMTAEDRKWMDDLLVEWGDPLAYQPGNQWSRFSALHERKHQFNEQQD
jgi:hypothetical protein